MAPSYSHTILITGSTSGLGYETASWIAKRCPGHLVVLAARTDGQSAAQRINSATGQENTIYLALDLSSMDAVRAFVGDYSQHGLPPVKALLLNAAAQFSSEHVHYSTDGIEKTFAINHVGHALLFYLMRPHLADDARIVITASYAHDSARLAEMPFGSHHPPRYTSAEVLAHPTPESQGMSGRQRYHTSKLCNVVWARALHRHVTRSDVRQNWTVNAFDPGLMPGTGLARELGSLSRTLWTKVLPPLVPVLRRRGKNVHTPEEAGRALGSIAVAQEFEGVSGAYFERGIRRADVGAAARERYVQDDLYNWTLSAVARGEAERSQFEKFSLDS